MEETKADALWKGCSMKALEQILENLSNSRSSVWNLDFEKDLADRGMVLQEEGEFVFDPNAGKVSIPVQAPSRLILLGAGHVSKELAQIGKMIGFQVVVVDNRGEFVTSDRFPGCLCICDSFEKALEDLHIGMRDYVCILTRGHADDFTCLHWMLSHVSCAYIGQIGSRRKVIQFMNALKEEGFDENLLASVHAPIGLDIHASTPAEIAVAIAAQLIEVRAEKSRVFDLDVHMFEQMQDLSKNCALMLIVKSSGSLPRKAGAAMVIDENGKTAGTIGGGKGEAQSMEKARSLIGSGEFALLDVFMDKNMAQKDGLICGGNMQVLIADLTGLI
jgi:xanthine dehydrogenase accessory factor